MADLNLIVSQIRQRLEILYQEIDKIEGGGGVSPDDAYTKEQSDALFVKKVAGKGLSTNDFTNAYKNQIDTNTTNIANLALDVNSIFEQENFTVSEGSVLPSDTASVLAKHRPFIMNGRTWYFLAEGSGVLDYFAIDNNTNGYPEIYYARIQESNRQLMVLESFGTDTTPIQNSNNFITSGGVYEAKTGLETQINTKANQSALTSEITARQTADTNLENYIDVVSNAGAKNLLNLTGESTQTATVNSDGTITVNGKNSSNVSLTLGTVSLKAGTYVLSSGVNLPQGVYLSVRVAAGETKHDCTYNVKSVAFTVPEDMTLDRAWLFIPQNTTIENLTIKPMIRHVEITDDTFVPYAPSNRELYEMILSYHPATAAAANLTSLNSTLRLDTPLETSVEEVGETTVEPDEGAME